MYIYPVADAYSATVQLSVSTPFLYIFSTFWHSLGRFRFICGTIWTHRTHFWDFGGPVGDFGQPSQHKDCKLILLLRFEGFPGSPFGSLFGHFLLFVPASVLFVNGVPVGARVPFWRFWGVRWAWFWASGVDAETEPTEGAILDSDWQGARIVFGTRLITIWHGGALILLE